MLYDVTKGLLNGDGKLCVLINVASKSYLCTSLRFIRVVSYYWKIKFENLMRFFAIVYNITSYKV